jgi:hypothetical protein
MTSLTFIYEGELCRQVRLVGGSHDGEWICIKPEAGELCLTKASSRLSVPLVLDGPPPSIECVLDDIEIYDWIAADRMVLRKGT